MRRITISCPSCHDEFTQLSMEEAENTLFHGCEKCRGKYRASIRGKKVSSETKVEHN